jgi:hypothetical protein
MSCGCGSKCIACIIEENISRLKCWKCGSDKVVGEKPKFVNGQPIDIYGCILVDSDDDYVLLVKTWCLDCRAWWTTTFTFDHNTLELKYVR